MSLLSSSTYSETPYESSWLHLGNKLLVTELPKAYPPQSGINQTALQNTQLRIRQLEDLSYDWDGFDSPAPSKDAIANAYRHAAILMAPLFDSTEFLTPHTSATGDAEVTFEWWKESRKLTLYFADNSIEYLKSWGTDLDNEMEHDSFRTDQFGSLYFWLING